MGNKVTKHKKLQSKQDAQQTLEHDVTLQNYIKSTFAHTEIQHSFYSAEIAKLFRRLTKPSKLRFMFCTECTLLRST